MFLRRTTGSHESYLAKLAAGDISRGFSVVRKAIGDELEDVSTDVLAAAGGLRGAKVQYFIRTEGDIRKSEVRLVAKSQTRRNLESQRLLSHLVRSTVYDTLEALPELGGDFVVRTGGLNSRDQVTPSGERVLSAMLDEDSARRIDNQSEAVRVAMAELAGAPLRRLHWFPPKNDIVLAFVSPDIPDEVFMDMREAVPASGFEFTVQPAQMLPRIRV